jgi:HAD superfamily hydrolase (TIGR01549 family)
MGQAGGRAGAPGSRRWFVLDIGEVLIDETRVWSVWADVLGLPAFTLMGAIGGAVASGGDHRDAFALLGAADWPARQAAFEARYGGFRAGDLYADALPSIAAVRAAGYGVAIMGNQPASRSDELRALGVDADLIAMSGELGVEKPDPAFFAAVVSATGAPPGDIAYVGDRVDNDVLPARAAGLRPVWLRRGPWGALHRLPEGVAVPQAHGLGDLAELAPRVWTDAAG